MNAPLIVFLAVTVVAVYAGCKHDGVEYEAGETWTVKDQCAQSTCQKNGDIYIKGCAQIRVSEGWKLTDEDLSKEYPACCPKPVKTA